MTVILKKETIRATISFGVSNQTIVINTPDVMSFNVNRTRGQMCATFNASVKVPASFVDDKSSSGSLLSDVVIKTTVDGLTRTIFTGKVYRCTVTPIFTDASKIMLNLSGKDTFCIMEGQKINRRVKSYKTGDGSTTTTPPDIWGVVTGITRDNSPLRATFPPKIISATPKAVTELPRTEVVRTLRAYDRDLDRNFSSPSTGIVWDIMPKEK